MALPILPILAGVALFAVVGGKKRRRRPAGEPEDAPGEDFPHRPPKRRPGSGYITALPSKEQPSVILEWNDRIARRAREIMEYHWARSSKNLSGAMFFMLMRDTAMEIWPNIRWPRTISDEMRQISIPPGVNVPVWIYNVENRGKVAEKIWINLRTIAWDITGFKMPV